MDAMTFALLPSPLLASGSGPVDLTGLPELPASCGILTSRAAVTSLGPAQQKPAFAVLEQAPAAAGVPTARAGRLTGQESAGKLGPTQGRCFLPNGQAAGRLHFPPPLCADDLGACHPRSQRLTHVSLLAVSQTFQGQTQRGPSPRSTDHGMAQVGPRKWLSPWPLLTHLHNPHIRRIDFRVSKITRAARRPSVWRRAGPLLTPNCQRPSALSRHTE